MPDARRRANVRYTTAARLATAIAMCVSSVLAFALPVLASTDDIVSIQSVETEHILEFPVRFEAGDLAGSSVAWDDDIAVVGVPGDDSMGTDAGAVYVYSWTLFGDPVLLWKITPHDLEAGDEFGSSVDIDGGTIVVGSPGRDEDAGRVHVYPFDSGAGTYSELVHALPSGAAGDRYGHSVAIAGDNVLVGAPYDDVVATDDGSATMLTVASGVLILTTQLGDADAPDDSLFGYSVDISSDGQLDLVVGSPGFKDVGLVHVYNQNFSDNWEIPGTGWTDLGYSVSIDSGSDIVAAGSPASNDGAGRVVMYQAGVERRDAAGSGSDELGHALDIRNDTLAIGLPGYLTDHGGVQSWHYAPSTETVSVRNDALTRSADDRYGSAVAVMSSSALLAGATGVGGTGDTSRLLVPLDWWAQWGPNAAATNPGTVPAEAVAIRGDVAVVASIEYPGWWGGFPGGAMVFERSGDAWGQGRLLLPPVGAAGQFFGASVDTDGDHVVVGAPHLSSGGSGEAVVYGKDMSGDWTVEDTLMSTVGAQASFGASVAINAAGVVVVGAPGNSVNGHTANGTSHVFESGAGAPAVGAWSEVQTLDGLDADYAGFGTAVAVSGELLAVSASSADGGLNPPGPRAVIIFNDDGAGYEAVNELPVPVSSSNYGVSLGITDRVVVVGQPSADAHVYGSPEGWLTGTPELLATLTPGDGLVGFGVAADGDGVVSVSGGGDVHSGLSNGSTYAAQAAMEVTPNMTGRADLACNEVMAATSTGAVIVEASIAPVSDAGGPYSAGESDTIVLDGSDSMVFGCDSTATWWFNSLPPAIGLTPAVDLSSIDGPATEFATLTILDSEGNMSVSSSVTVTVDNTAPVLDPVTIPDSGAVTAGEPVTLSLGAEDNIGDSVSFSVDWGDGTIEAASITSSTATHEYEFPGSYDVVVTATDSDGAASVSELSVTVAPRAVSGYWILGVDGAVHRFGSATSEAPLELNGATAVDIEAARSGSGYWVLDDAGVVHARNNAAHFGNVDGGALDPGETPVSISATPHGDGYWVFTTRGRVLAFGSASHFGDVSHLVLNGPVLDSVATPTGLGYYMVASDGGVFTNGDASFSGSTGAMTLDRPVKTLVPDPDGDGYWLFAEDGGVFSFGAPYRGSIPGVVDGPLNRPISAAISFGDAYLLVGLDGGIFNFSTRPFYGSTGSDPPPYDMIGVAASRL